MNPLKAGLLIFLIAVFSVAGYAQPGQTALSLYKKGKALQNEKPEQAYAPLKQAVLLSRQSNDRDLYLNSLNALAVVANKGSDAQYKEAIAWLKEAIEVYRTGIADSLVAELHFNLAILYDHRAYEVEPAIANFKEAMSIWTSLFGEWNAGVAKCYHGLGDLYKYATFDFLEAEKSYEKALLIREKIHFNDPRVLYQNYYSLASTNRSQHDFEKAISYGNKTLELAEELKNLKYIEMGSGMIANIYRDMNDPERAKQYYTKAITINKKTNNLENRAWYYQSIGELLMVEGKAKGKAALYDEAVQNFLIAYAIYKTEEDTPLFMNLLIHMADVYQRKRDRGTFLRTVREAFGVLALLDKSNSKEAYTLYLLLGDYHQEKKDYDSALVNYQKALAAAVPAFTALQPKDNPSEKEIGFVYYIYEGLAKKAAALKSKFVKTNQSDYLRYSLDCLVLAERLVSLERNTLDMEASKWEFLDTNYDIYEDIISSLYAGINVLPVDTVNNLAFRYFERSKSRSLADAISETEHTRQISNQDSLFQAHTELKRKLFDVQQRVNVALETKGSTKEVAALRDEIVSLDRNIQACKVAIEEKYPGYFNVKYGYHTPSLREVQQTIADRDQVILEYFWGTHGVYAFGINSDQVLFKRIGSSDSIKVTVDGLLLHLDDEHSSLKKEVFQQFTTNSHKLYSVLMQPFQATLENKRRVQIIPDGPISQVPFEILTVNENSGGAVDYRSLNYLIRSFTIGYAYSSSMIMQRLRALNNKPSLLAVGFTGGKRLRAADPGLEEIQGAERELEALEKRFSAGRFLVDKEATEANFKSLSPAYDIIHLAIHGKGDVQKNYSASLYFRTKYDTLDDGELHAYELYGLKLKAFMAVLSSCESGLGKDYKGEGMISMASAFTYSGCENILMSLWKVNDQASIALMDDFYGYLQEGETIDDALRNAKLNYLTSSDELTADPKIWGPLVAYGSLGHVFQKDRSRIFIFGTLGILAILLLVYKMRK